MTVGFTAIGVLLALLGVPLLQRRIKPNLWYGLRVEATLADERVWYAANAASGRDFAILGVVQVAVALLATALPEPMYFAVNIGTLVIGTIVVAVVGIQRANRLRARSREQAAAVHE